MICIKNSKSENNVQPVPNRVLINLLVVSLFGFEVRTLLFEQVFDPSLEPFAVIPSHLNI
jgi:hypothetical protein